MVVVVHVGDGTLEADGVKGVKGVQGDAPQDDQAVVVDTVGALLQVWLVALHQLTALFVVNIL